MSTGKKVLTAIIVLVILYVVYNAYTKTPVAGELGGVTVPADPNSKGFFDGLFGSTSTNTIVAPDTIDPVPSTPVTGGPRINPVGAKPPVNVIVEDDIAVPLVSKIVIKKEVPVMSDKPDNDTFQIGEVKVYDRNHILLRLEHFASAEFANNTGYSSSYPGKNVLDGDLYTFAHSMPDNIQTLTLALKIPQTITKIEIFNRGECCHDRLNGAVLTLLSVTGKVIYSRTLTGTYKNIYEIT
jgi:hypothetical protein